MIAARRSAGGERVLGQGVCGAESWEGGEVLRTFSLSGKSIAISSLASDGGLVSKAGLTASVLPGRPLGRRVPGRHLVAGAAPDALVGSVSFVSEWIER